jgi:hypothetical protein
LNPPRPKAIVSHTGLRPEQVELSTHCTQFAFVSHIVAPASVHCALLVQPAWQDRPMRPIGPNAARHTGVAGFVQSLFVTHATHVSVPGSQCGVVPVQLLSAWHCTHRIVAESQTGEAVGQSIEVRQPTQAPVVVSQKLVPIGHGAPPSPQAAWQV